ncbi:hypothetical protein DZF91_35275 [Actinomadura logoneensis]|uniref:Uncharacterized protein n=1 Tax=Actinomadura logoneensis TaxID=2293572 RepID=A0A372JAD4_9ACTN|nr:hypothetical protein [Actinomadura logoneensis]RFU36981.1 hypothetical protein DZF91_35275 [Actinomadura logoneensis]
MADDLAMDAARTLVTALAGQAAEAVSALARQILSRRRPEAEVATRLEETREVLTAVPAARDGESVRWAGEFRRILDEDPGARSEVEHLMELIGRLRPDVTNNAGVQQSGSVGGDNIQIQGSGDVTVVRDSGGSRWRRRR